MAEVKLPDPKEWAGKILRNRENKRLTQWLADFQRETLLTAARRFSKRSYFTAYLVKETLKCMAEETRKLA